MSALQAARIAVMKEVGYVQKQSSPNLNYKYAGEQALIAALRPSMIEQGLTLHPIKVESLQCSEYTTSNNKMMQVVRAIVHLQMTHVSGEAMALCVASEASDSSDKATAKMMTSAYKYALRQFFVIETGDDGDEERADREMEKDSNILLTKATVALHECQTLSELDKKMASILDAEQKAKFTAEHLAQLNRRCDQRRESLIRKGGAE